MSTSRSDSGRTASRPPTRTGTSSVRPPSRPGTARTSASTSGGASEDGEWVIAVLEGRGIGREVGVVAIERDLCKVIVTQFGDSATFVKLLHLCTTRPPSLILVPSSSLANATTTTHGREGHADHDGGTAGGGRGDATLLVRSLRDAFRTTPMIGVARKYWDEQAGFEFLTQLIIHDDKRTGTILAAKSKYYALSASSALFKYLETAHSLIFPPRSLRIEYSPLEGTCLIDTETATNLELVSNLLNKHSKQHLLGLLNHCYTPMATRLLRSNILSPLTDVTVIDTRLDAVEELVNSEERFSAIRKALEPLKSLDCDKLVGQLVSSRCHPRSLSSASKSDPSKDSEAKIARLLQLRVLLSSLPALRSALHHSDSQLLKAISRILQDERADRMLQAIGETINEDAVTTLQKGALAVRNTRIYALRAEKRLLLDVARETYKENLNDAFELCEDMKAKHGIEMGLQYSGGTFVFSVPKTELEDKELPRVFTNVNKKGKKVEFSSMDLKKKNARILESVQEIFIMSNEILDELFDEIRTAIACLYRCSEAIAMLDMLASFSDVSSKSNYVRPEWTDTLAIKAGRHPLHEHFRLADGSFVPNDTYASDAASFQIVSGSNMSGKSTLLRQIALLYIMGQIGCFVPAEYASFRVVDALLSRLGNDDSIEASLSTFAQEMSTMAMILSALGTCKQCLVIIDELGRGTSPEEGVGIAHALAESIIKAKALCFFATHFKELSLTLSHYPNVVSLHLETEIDRSQPDYSLTFHHRVVDGTTPLTHYGLELAKLAKLPSDVIDKATRVSSTLESLSEQGRQRAQGTQLAIRRKELLRLKTTLKELSQSRSLSGQELVETLRELQNDAVKMLSATMAYRGASVVEKGSPSVSSKEQVQEQQRRSFSPQEKLSLKVKDRRSPSPKGQNDDDYLGRSRAEMDADTMLDDFVQEVNSVQHDEQPEDGEDDEILPMAGGE